MDGRQERMRQTMPRVFMSRHRHPSCKMRLREAPAPGLGPEFKMG